MLGTKEYDETGNLIDEDTYRDGSCVEKCEWTKTFGKGEGESVQQTVDGGFIATGNDGDSDTNDHNIFLLKTDGQGNEKWRKTLEGWEGYESSVQQTVDGGLLLRVMMDLMFCYSRQTTLETSKDWTNRNSPFHHRHR